GMYATKTPAIHKQRQSGKPVQIVAPLMRMIGKLFGSFLPQAGMALVVVAYKQLLALHWCRQMPGQRIVFMVAHKAMGVSRLHHAINNFQRGANLAAAINNIAQKNRHARRVLPYTCKLPVAQKLQQTAQTIGTAVQIANYVVTAATIDLH